MGRFNSNAMSMPPWDAAAYFQRPQEVVVTVPAAGVIQLVPYDSMRVALIIIPIPVLNARVSLRSNPGFGEAIDLNALTDPFVMLFNTTGPLCQQEWFALGGAGTVVTCYTVVLSKWPTVEVPGGKVLNALDENRTQRSDNRRRLPTRAKPTKT